MPSCLLCLYYALIYPIFATFKKELERYSGRKLRKPKDWYEAFDALREYISSLHKERIVVFLDELPWMDTPSPASFLLSVTSGTVGRRLFLD